MKQAGNKTSQKKIAMGSLVVIAAFAFLIAGSLRTNTLQALPVGELRQADDASTSRIGQRLRVRGFVGQTPIRRVVDEQSGAAGSTQFFQVVEGKQTLDVEYRDVLPETCKPGSPVQVDGVYYAPGKFRAERVLTKCPSKYQAEEIEGQASKKAEAGSLLAEPKIKQSKIEQSQDSSRSTPSSTS